MFQFIYVLSAEFKQLHEYNYRPNNQRNACCPLSFKLKPIFGQILNVVRDYTMWWDLVHVEGDSDSDKFQQLPFQFSEL